jgi:hypothetical protein
VEDRVLLVAAYWRTNLTLRQIAPLFGVSKSAADDGHIQTGEPLHVDVTALLLARGADPLRSCNSITAAMEAEQRGHWLATELMRAWLGRPR